MIEFSFFGEILFEVKFECSFKSISVCKYTTIKNVGVSKQLITVFRKDRLNGSHDIKYFYDATKDFYRKYMLFFLFY